MPEQITHPINAFPEDIQKIICHYSEAKGYPIEFFIQSMLGAVSTAIGRSITLNTGNYTTIGSVWCIILGKRGVTKSEPLDDAFKPIRAHHFKLMDQYMADLDEYHEYKRTHPKSKEPAPTEPPKHTVNDTTPEKLVLMLAANPKGLGMVYDEIGGFVGRFNRYNSGGDEQMFLSLFNGSSIMRDRINGTSAYAKHTYLTIIGTTQPAILREMFGDKTESGFFDRWLITQPENITKQYPNQFGINPVEEAKYNNIITPLLHLPFEPYNGFQMRYNPDSYAIINEYQRFMVDEQNTTDSDDYRGILAKMEIYLHKFALLLQCIIFTQNNECEFVSVEAAQGAVILTKYFISEALRVRVLNPVEKLKDKWADVYSALPEHGVKFDRKHFVKIAKAHGFSDSAADKFLKEVGLRSETSLFYKIQHGQYTKNLF